MRDIKDYEDKYVVEPCEKYQVVYRRKKVLEVMNKYSHRNILEVGCGMEPIFQFMDDYKTMTIVEPGEAFVSNANKCAKELKRNVQCIQQFFEDSVQDLIQNKKEFDYVIVSSLLHEVEEPQKLLKAVYSICSFDTVVHINVPNAYSVHRLLAEKMGLIENIHDLSNLQKTMQRNRVYDFETLAKEVEKAGFEVIEKGSYFPKLLSASQMEKMLKEKIISEKIFQGLDKMIEYFPDNGSEIYIQVKKKQI